MFLRRKIKATINEKVELLKNNGLTLSQKQDVRQDIETLTKILETTKWFNGMNTHKGIDQRSKFEWFITDMLFISMIPLSVLMTFSSILFFVQHYSNYFLSLLGFGFVILVLVKVVVTLQNNF